MHNTSLLGENHSFSVENFPVFSFFFSDLRVRSSWDQALRVVTKTDNPEDLCGLGVR